MSRFLVISDPHFQFIMDAYITNSRIPPSAGPLQDRAHKGEAVATEGEWHAQAKLRVTKNCV